MELKNCPFCGGNEVSITESESSTARHNEGAVHFSVGCFSLNCKAMPKMNLWHVCPEDAADAWNRRVNSEEPSMPEIKTFVTNADNGYFSSAVVRAKAHSLMMVNARFDVLYRICEEQKSVSTAKLLQIVEKLAEDSKLDGIYLNALADKMTSNDNERATTEAMLNMEIQQLKDAAVERTDGWISVSSEPQIGQRVLILIPVCGRYNIENATYRGDGVFTGCWCSRRGNGEHYGVDWWMPEPALPKMQTENI